MKLPALILLILTAFLASCYGAQQTINIGTTPSDGTGDTLRTAFGKVNANFTELYSLTSAINASNITTGTLPIARLADGSVTNAKLLNNSVTINGTAVSLGGSITLSSTPTGGAGGVLSGTYPNPGFAVDMATQSELDAKAPLANPTFTGTINGAALSLSGSISVTGSISTGSGNFETTVGNISTGSGIISGNGSSITSLNASNISSGTLAIARLADGSITTAKLAAAAQPAFANLSGAARNNKDLEDELEDGYDAQMLASITLPCDAVPGCLAAWGLVPLKASALGSTAFTLRKTADSTTSAFSFTAGRTTPVSAVDAWKGSETSYNARKATFSQINDQIGSNHLTQATTTAQPAWLQLPSGRVVAAMNGDNLSRDAFFDIPNASWSSRNLTVVHVMLPNERTWSGSSAWLAINQLNFGWANSAGGYTGLTGAQSGDLPVTRIWWGGSYTDSNPRLSNTAPQIVCVRFGASNTTYTLHDGTRATTTVQPNGTLTSGAIGRLGSFALYGNYSNWIATLIYPELDDTELAALLASVRQRFSMGRWFSNVVFVGDSITAGHTENEGSFDVRYNAWPWECMASLPGTARVKAVNLAISSQTLETMQTAAAQLVDTTLDNTHDDNTLVILAGTNDINAGASSSTTISRLTTYYNARRAAGWDKIIICTNIPRENFDSAKNAALASYNAFIVANTLGANAVVDLSALSWSFGTHYQGSTPNRIHPNAAGRTLIANAVRTALAALVNN